jgi:hypothetical protein
VFERAWLKQRKKFIDKPSGVLFDTVMAIGLPWLVEVAKMPLVRQGGASEGLGDVNLVFRPAAGAGRPLGISFCNHDPRHLWRRLDRLLAQWQAAKGKALGSLVALRSASERTTDTAKERFTRLKQAGVSVLLVEAQQLAELAAYQAMLTGAQKGDLTRAGKPVEVVEYNGWAAGHLSSAVKELAHLIFGTGLAPAPTARPSRAAAKA